MIDDDSAFLFVVDEAENVDPTSIVKGSGPENFGATLERTDCAGVTAASANSTTAVDIRLAIGDPTLESTPGRWPLQGGRAKSCLYGTNIRPFVPFFQFPGIPALFEILEVWAKINACPNRTQLSLPENYSG